MSSDTIEKHPADFKRCVSRHLCSMLPGRVVVTGVALSLFLLPAAVASTRAVDRYVVLQMQQLRLPGLALAVIRDGKPLIMRSYGIADLENQTAVTSDTVFELGSVSKQFTAMAILRLVEEGRIRLDDPITLHLPELPDDWRDVTIRHLLNHASGIREYLSIEGLPDAAHRLAHRDMTRLFGERVPREFPPGETWSYSNTGYLLLGDIIERASGQSYWDFLESRIFGPAGMKSTGSSAPRTLIRRRARGYGWGDGVYENRPALSENAYAAGAIVSTLADMIRWEALLQRQGVVGRDSYLEMWTPLSLNDRSTPPFNYGFGWVVDRENGERAVFHSGGTPGFSSAIRRYPDRRITVIVLANHGDRILDHIPMEVAALVAPALRRVGVADPQPERSARLEKTLRRYMIGEHDPEAFTPVMQRFLATATGKGLGEWIGSHGELQSFKFVKSEPSGGDQSLRYRVTLGGAELWVTFTMTPGGRIAQLYWW